MLLKDLGMSVNENGNKIRLGIYRCEECENEFKRNQYQVNRKRSKNKILLCLSCVQRSNGSSHGRSSSRLHRIWTNIKQRCTNTKIPDYIYYGERGIAMCEDWFNNFESFFIWANANGYSDKLTIDREDNDGNYEPSNCRWVDKFVQARNRGCNSQNTSGVVGVSYHKGSSQWIARQMRNGKAVYIGGHKEKEKTVHMMEKYIKVKEKESR